MAFIHENFLLQNATGQRLYHEFAKGQPILDYHNHLPPEDIASNRQFSNLFEIWLEGDHYKWRAMRANGMAEEFVTGDADPYDKFLAFAKTVPHTLRNPLYHWTHLELKRYFGIDELLDESTAPAIWKAANDQLSTEARSTRGILEEWDVRALCTTDDPNSDLADHISIAESGFRTRVYPTFRPDRAFTVDDPASFNDWCDSLSEVSGVEITDFASLQEALRQRHEAFHAIGGRLSDHGMGACPASYATDEEAAEIFKQVQSGDPANPAQKDAFSGNMMLMFGRLGAEKGWTMQLHLGPMRNNSTRLFKTLGPDTGFDSMGDLPQGESLSRFLGLLDEDDRLPKTVLYNLNPSDNYLFATMAGNFNDGTSAGKVQFGSGWWFLDQKEAMEWQMNALSNCGLFSRFVGMLTDSRSFMSFPRHEYFRRTLCNLVGSDIEAGYLPDSDDLVGPMIENICYGNAHAFLGLETAGS